MKTLALTTVLALSSLGVSAFAQTTPADATSPKTQETSKKHKRHHKVKRQHQKSDATAKK